MKIRTDIKSGSGYYTVQSGDNLSSIAQSQCGSASAENVASIYYYNQAVIGSDPNLIYAGQVLYIPC
jgi:nucleoid-associated protein YgaU